MAILFAMTKELKALQVKGDAQRLKDALIQSLRSGVQILFDIEQYFPSMGCPRLDSTYPTEFVWLQPLILNFSMQRYYNMDLLRALLRQSFPNFMKIKLNLLLNFPLPTEM